MTPHEFRTWLYHVTIDVLEADFAALSPQERAEYTKLTKYLEEACAFFHETMVAMRWLKEVIQNKDDRVTAGIAARRIELCRALQARQEHRLCEIAKPKTAIGWMKNPKTV
jgi:hypothetical protein